MVKCFNYLYFKLYIATLRGSLNDTAPFASTVCLGGLVAINLISAGVILSKLTVVPFFLSSKYEAGILADLCILIFAFILKRVTIKKLSVIIKENQQRKNQRECSDYYLFSYFTCLISIASVGTELVKF